jgi:CIC family chloride channel protein
MLATLCVVKLLATTTSFVSGTPGGLFAPTLFMGAMLGAAVCGVERQVAPGIAGPMGAYALIGMGTMFAGILRAPMTSVFMIVEVSGNYSIILPVMISNTLAYVVSRQFQRHPLFDVLGRQDGTDLPSMEEEREVETHTVEDAMRPVDGAMLDGSESIERAVQRAEQAAAEFFLVNLGAGAWGGISRQALLERCAEDATRSLASTIVPLARPYLYPDQSVESALRVLQERPVLPVVHRADPSLVVGMLALDDVLRLYRSATAA